MQSRKTSTISKPRRWIKLYKLTDKHDCTRSITQWGVGVKNPDGIKLGGELCSARCYHATTDPLLAVFLDPIQGNYGKDAHLWVCRGIVSDTDCGLKVGCTELETLKQISKPQPALIQRIAFGILCAKAVCRENRWNSWADRWLFGIDRGYDDAANKDKAADAFAAARYAAYAVYAYTKDDADADAYAATAAAEAARIPNKVHLIAIAKKAMKVK